MEYLDIGPLANDPRARRLGPMFERRFVFDGVECSSVMAVFESFKMADVNTQKAICNEPTKLLRQNITYLTKVWNKERKVRWLGVEYNRFQSPFTELQTRVFDAVFEQDESYRMALQEAEGYGLLTTALVLDSYRTTLTGPEFLAQTYRLITRSIYEG